MNVITEFEDDSRIFFDKGEFDEYCIYYQEKNLGRYYQHKINMIFLLKKVRELMSSNLNNIKLLRKLFRKEIYQISDLSSHSLDELDNIINKYDFNSDILWKKVAYMVLSMYYAEDNHPKTILFRSMFRHAISRVLDGENAEFVSKDYHEKSVIEIQDMIMTYDNRNWSKRMGNTCGW